MNTMISATHLHAMVVHFPIALLFVGFLFDLIGAFNGSSFFRQAGLSLLVLGAAGAVAAYFSGEAAGEGMEEGSLGRAVALHEQAALITAVGSVLVALLRGGLMVLKRYEGWPRLLSLFLFTLLIASVARTGYLGGQLVYRHAAGVELSLPAISDTE
ncbi:MAG: hypothetical protein KDD19_17030 [Phaeodactylibacter sp.]|nr:hypothetical protein [Phaeodactylibacter sp.]MCB9050984.1 hypothetical protein [Lewinellaceae bacterium]